ncbi:MAG: thermostable hemolysin delta-VPH [Clostridia bacterium]|nr:thermostable hemolysin delta-VPH [Clostridia bacterium]
MMYFNYHAKVKRLILEGRLTGYEFVDEYHGIKPALVLYFKDARPMPIRDYMWEEYLPILEKFDKNQ